MSRSDATRARIGNRMRQRRRALGMTQEQCAGLIGMSRLSLTRIELGYRRIKLPELAGICDALGCAPEELLDDAALAVAARHNHERLYGAVEAP
jgi:transcriptional regulator with XRE-family HTH domain